MTPKFCRMAWRVDDIERFTGEMRRLLGLEFHTPGIIAQLYPDGGFKVMFGEHGVEPIQPGPEGLPFVGADRLIEIAIDVDDAQGVREKLGEAGHEPMAISYLPVPDVSEYLFGRDFHGVPFLACDAGVNEAQVRSEHPDFPTLDDAAPPKIGCVTLKVADADAIAADLKAYYGMDFVEMNAAGFGRRMLGGKHRVRLLEGPSSLLDGVEGPLASVDFIVGDVEAARERFEAAGFRARDELRLGSGGKAYFFGPTVEGFPVTVYPQAADAEMIGLAPLHETA